MLIIFRNQKSSQIQSHHILYEKLAFQVKINVWIDIGGLRPYIESNLILANLTQKVIGLYQTMHKSLNSIFL